MQVNKNRLPNLRLKIILIYLVAILFGNVFIGYFLPSGSADSPPSGVILYIPSDNSYLNDATPTLTWYPSFDADGDPLKYEVEVYDSLNNLVAYNLTDFFITTWDVTPQLQDGQTYHWRVHANDDQFQLNSTGPWSAFWFFTVDITPPSISSGSADFTTYTGNNFNIYANFTDNIGVEFSTLYYKKSSDNYKSQPMLESTPDQFYISNDLLAINTTNDDEDYFYYIIAGDLAGNNVNYSKAVTDFQITVQDDLQPNLNYGSGNITTTTDDEFSVFIFCFDNIGIAKANLDIRKIGTFWETIELNKYYQNYYINYTDLKSQIGLNTSDGIDCEYYILIEDHSTNILNYSNPLGAPWTISVQDNDAPAIVQGSGNLDVTTDDPFTIYSNFTDNIDVTSAILSIRAITGPNLNWYKVNMYEIPANIFGLDYKDLKTHPGLQMDTTSGRNYEYYILAYDAANNICNYSHTINKSWDIIVNDNDPPSIISCSGDFEVTTGDPFVISAEFTDNIAVASVKIFFYHLDNSSTGGDPLPPPENWLNILMNHQATGGDGLFVISYDDLKSGSGLDTTSGGLIKYYLVASDPTGNQYRYPEVPGFEFEITITDVEMPIVFYGTGDLTVYTAENFTIYVDFYDCLAATTATLYYRPTSSSNDPQNGEWSGYDMLSTVSPLGSEYIRFSATNFELEIDTLYEDLDYNYYIIVNVSNSNPVYFGTSTDPYRITIIDNVAPKIDHWELLPHYLYVDDESDFVVRVVLSDIGGSGFNAQSVMLRYKRASFDNEFINYTYMEDITSDYAGTGLFTSDDIIYTKWEFIIPRPHLEVADPSQRDGWELISGEDILYDIRATDSNGNIVVSDLREQYVMPKVLNHAPKIHIIAPNGNENYTGTQYIFWSATDLDQHAISITIELSDDNGNSWQVLAADLQNTGSYKFETWHFSNGDGYLIKITGTDSKLSGTAISDQSFVIYNSDTKNIPGLNEDHLEPKDDEPTDIIPFIIAGIIIAIIVASAGFIGGTEVGKYKFYSLILVPLYSKLNRDEVLDHFMRGQIFGYIKANPGEHYNAIKESLELNNGTLSHHLKILEKEEYIYSKRDKFYTRFYPKGMKISVVDAAQLNKIQKIIVNKVRERPGLTQHEIITILGASQQVVSYNLTKLTRENVLRIAKQGREKRYYINHVDAAVSEIKAANPSQPTVQAPAQQTIAPAPTATSSSPIPVAQPTNTSTPPVIETKSLD